MSENTNNTPKPFVVGANHKSSAMSIRDRLFVEDDQVPGVLEKLRGRGVGEAMVLSTCDRVEVQGIHDAPDEAARHIVEVLAEHGELKVSDLEGQTYALTGDEAVRQIFRVAASLDSLVVGEPQVLGQVKSCHRLATEAGMAGNGLEAILQAAYTAAKRARNETAIGERPVTIAAAAARLAQDLHGDLGKRSGLLIGTGEMGELVAEAMQAEGLGDLIVVHSIVARAEALARELNCHVADYEDLSGLLDDADIVLTAQGARRHVVTADMMQVAIHRRRRRPVFLVDTSLPGDVDPSVNRIEEAFLYDLADLEGVVMDGRASREGEAAKASDIVDAEVDAFLRGRAERVAVPALGDLRGHFEGVRQQVMKEAGDDAEKATRLLVNRLLHTPSEAMRDEAARGSAGGGGWQAAEDVIRRLFGLSSRTSGDGGKNEDENT
ncbi:MAG: glutamyl-tRNA reductase [Rhodospirillales bacterium]|nr:glutamyl-tRNA reductase [Alphaproteobacteria bacterium]MBL6948816.1 glutamyl-tRNA reductase [Rhodospirillales bacterium]